MNSPYTQLVSGFLFPLQERLKGHQSVALRQRLEASQWLPREQIQAMQSQKLGGFIQRIYHQVPYYRRILDERDIDPRSIADLSQLKRLPLLTKSIIREQLPQLKADNASDLKPFNTGGSSGSPLIFFLNKERISHDVAAKWRATRWWGVDIGDREIVAWGSPIELTAQDRLKGLRDKLLRSQLIPAFDLGPQQTLEFLKRIRQFRPRMLFGYPSVYDLLARRAEAAALPMDDLDIRVAFVTSEKLYDHQRERISRVFGCEVANGYGGRDAGFIAHECPRGGLHISAEDIIVEIINPDDGQPVPNGQLGEIVVTHLATSAFPFVRYRTGDIGVLGTRGCPCGRGLPLLERIEGRSTDFVVAQDGTVMHGLALIYVLREIPGIDEFKIWQQTRDSTTVDVVLETGRLTDDLRQQIVQGLRQRLGQRVEIKVNQVARIQAEASGKYRYVKSEVELAVS